MPAAVARYRIEGEIARGGMGVVYRGHDSTFGRALAVKVLRDEYRGQPDFERRFLEEARLTGRLQHPGIPPVHELGTLPDGRPFFGMKLIKGSTLAELLGRRASPADDRPRFLAVFAQVCQAVAYAHSRGVIHRDLKPANVMVGAFGEVQVMDWGLAKVLGKESGEGEPAGDEGPSTVCGARAAAAGPASQAGSVRGTPAYMAPEQARGEADRLDERCDVFGLGAILCAILTGRPPYLGPTREDLYRQAAQADLAGAYARLEACGADAELVRLARACLGPRREDRPRDAGAVARAVAAYQAAVQERLRQAERERAAAEVRAQEERKHRKLTAALAAAGLLLVSLGGVAAWWYQREQAAQGAERAARDAERAARQAATERDVTAALDRAAKLNEQGWDQTGDPASWQATLRDAQSAWDRAEGLLNSGEPTEELRARLRVARAKLEEAAAECRLTVELDGVRLLLAETKDGQWTYPQAAAQYVKAFQKHGLDVPASDPETVAGWLEGRRLRERLLAALEDWAAWAPAKAERQRLLAAVRAADPSADSFRNRWREALDRGDGATLADLADRADLGNLSPTAFYFLGRTLRGVRAEEAAVRLLREGQARYPGDFWLNLELGIILGTMKPAQPEEAVRFLTAAVALRNRSTAAHINLGLALKARGNLAGAIRCLRTATELDPKLALGHYNLGIVLQAQGDLEGAARAFRTAVELAPEDAQAHYQLGLALQAQGKVEEAVHSYRTVLQLDPTNVPVHNSLGTALQARGDLVGAIRAFRTAVELNPKDALAHNNLGNALKVQGDIEGALRSLRTALELDPKSAPAHYNLGNALKAKGDLDGAIRAFRAALELDPKHAQAHHNLGTTLQAKGDLDGALRCLRTAVELGPKDPTAHLGLGLALMARGDLDGAVRAFRTVVELDPKDVNAHGALGQALLLQGRFAEACQATQRALELLPPRDPLRGPAGRQLRQCEQLLALDQKLPAVLKGDAKPADAAERLALADLCREYKQRYAAAARLAADAFAEEPRLADDLRTQARYHAACAAALAAAGRGQDAGGLDANERTRLRAQALDWLRADLALWNKELDKGTPPTGTAVRRALTHWQQDTDFASVRDKEALAKLPEAERAAWARLWADVDALLAKAKEAK